MPDYRQIARQVAQKHGIDPDIFVAQIGAESGFNPKASSGVAFGIAQFTPATAKGLGLDYNDPIASLNAAAKLDAERLKSYGGDWKKTLAAYNAGPGAVSKYGGVPPYKETQNYVAKILGGRSAQAVQGAVQGATQTVTQSTASLPKINLGFEIDPAAEKIRKQAYAGLEAWRTRAGRQALAGQIPETIPRKLLKRYAAYAPKELTLPEPTISTTKTTLSTGGFGSDAAKGAGGKFTLPLATAIPKTSSYSTPDGPEGVPTSGGGHIHGGMDWFAPGGSALRAPVGGTIIEAHPSRGNTGQVFGGTVKIQAPDGRVYVFRHVNPKLRVGAKVDPGFEIATVTPWAGGSSHAHMEIWKTLGGGYNASNLIDPLTVYGSGR